MLRGITNRKRVFVRIVLVGLTAAMIYTVLYSDSFEWANELHQPQENVGFSWTSTKTATYSSWTSTQKTTDSTWTPTQRAMYLTWTWTRKAVDSSSTSTKEDVDSTWESKSTTTNHVTYNRMTSTSHTKATLFWNETKKVESSNKQLNNSQRPPILILMWRPLYKYLDRVKREMEKHCPKHNCRVTTDRKYMPKADAVVFEIEKMYNLPTKTKLGQVWVYVEMESPALWGNGIKTWTNLFNWTMTYRRDSDITHFYGSLTKKNQEVNRTLSPDLFLNKTGRMLWLVSNCHTAGKRENFVKELQKFTPVDVVGRCGKSVCPKRSNCETSLMKNYKFYFAAENSNCRDYITEKAIRPYGHYILPVVRGGANYSLYFPPKSYIDFSSQKFGNIRNLTNYLNDFHRNRELLNNYINVKEGYRAGINYEGIPFCTLCDKLNDQSKFRRLYRSIHDWWRGQEGTSGYFCEKNELVRL